MECCNKQLPMYIILYAILEISTLLERDFLANC